MPNQKPQATLNFNYDLYFLFKMERLTHANDCFWNKINAKVIHFVFQAFLLLFFSLALNLNGL